MCEFFNMQIFIYLRLQSQLIFHGCLYRRYEQAHFTAFLSSYMGNWWVGLRAKGDLGGVDYQWDNGAALLYTHWDRDYPGNMSSDELIISLLCHKKVSNVYS